MKGAIDRVLEPYRCLGWRFPAIMLAVNVVALGIGLAWEHWR